MRAHVRSLGPVHSRSLLHGRLHGRRRHRSLDLRLQKNLLQQRLVRAAEQTHRVQPARSLVLRLHQRREQRVSGRRSLRSRRVAPERRERPGERAGGLRARRVARVMKRRMPPEPAGEPGHRGRRDARGVRRSLRRLLIVLERGGGRGHLGRGDAGDTREPLRRQRGEIRKRSSAADGGLANLLHGSGRRLAAPDVALVVALLAARTGVLLDLEGRLHELLEAGDDVVVGIRGGFRRRDSDAPRDRPLTRLAVVL